MRILDLKDQPQHLTLLAEWHHRQWVGLNPGRSLQQRCQEMQAYLSAELIPSTFIAVAGDTVLGSAALIDCDMDTHPEWTPWLASVFVAPAYRRQGIATRLIEHCCHQAQAAGIAQLYLFTPDQADFYLARGWQILGVEDYRQHAVTVMRIVSTTGVVAVE